MSPVAVDMLDDRRVLSTRGIACRVSIRFRLCAGQLLFQFGNSPAQLAYSAFVLKDVPDQLGDRKIQ